MVKSYQGFRGFLALGVFMVHLSILRHTFLANVYDNWLIFLFALWIWNWKQFRLQRELRLYLQGTKKLLLEKNKSYLSRLHNYHVSIDFFGQSLYLF